jgi:hypothetical protein
MSRVPGVRHHATPGSRRSRHQPEASIHAPRVRRPVAPAAP